MTTKMERYTTTSGEVIEYPAPAADVARYLARVIDAANDPRVTENDLVELVYSKDNPIMNTTLFPGRGAVTKEVFANPVYHVMHDLLFSKRLLVEHGERTGAVVRGLSVTEAAEQLGMSPSAVRQAVRRGDLEATKVRGAHSIDPASIVTYRGRVKRRGPRGAGAPDELGPALRIRTGNEPEHSFRVKALGVEVIEKTRLENGGRMTTAVVPSFERAAVVFSGKEMNRMFVLEPADELDSFDFGSFRIEGRYRVVEKINGGASAAKAWKTFRAR